MYEQHLTTIGLSREQARIYEMLVRSGALQASVVARKTALPRTLAYTVLSQLQKLGLVEKQKKKGSVSTFSAAHPFKIQELARKRLSAAEQAGTALNGILSSIISDFNTSSGQPGIRILEGIEGLKELYKDVLRERQTICLIRSLVTPNSLPVSSRV